MGAVRKGLGVLLLAASALAGPDEEIARIFAEPASLPGKLDFEAYSRLQAERGYPKTRSTADDLRLEVARYFGRMLAAPCRVQRIRVAEDGVTATAVVSHGGWLMRWFLVKGKERWWYADFEDVGRALRFTDWDHAPAWLREALGTEDHETAVNLLLSPPEGTRPATIEAARLARLVHGLWATGREKEALRCCDGSSRPCDAPVIDLRRSYAALAAEQYELAVKSANDYLDKVGDDPEGCCELGRALFRLDRRAEAAAAHVRGLRTDPTAYRNVLGLYRALPDDGKSAAAEHFLKLDPLPEWFAYLGRQFANAQEWTELDALVAAYRKGHEDDPSITKYEAEASAGRERHAKAAPLFLAVLPKCGEDRAYYASMYLRSMEALKRPLEGYEQLSPDDRDLAWSFLAYLLAYGGDAATLEALLAKRRDRPDRSVAIWEIELRWMREEYAEVDALFRKHVDEISASGDEHRSLPPDRQVRSLLRLGKAADALAPARAHDDPILLFAVYAAMGRNEEALGVLESGLAEKRKFADFEKDEDAGPLLAGEAFAPLRAKHGGKK